MEPTIQEVKDLIENGHRLFISYVIWSEETQEMDAHFVPEVEDIFSWDLHEIAMQLLASGEYEEIVDPNYKGDIWADRGRSEIRKVIK